MTDQIDLRLRRFAAWHERFLAYLVDIAPLFVLFLVLAVLTDDADSYLPIGFWFSTDSSSSSVMISGFPSIFFDAVMLGWFVWNWLVRQGKTGQTVGKKVIGVAVLGANHQPIGPGMTLARQFAHVLDFLPCFLGYLWPIWDREKRTFADMIVGTRVHQVGAGRL